MAGTELCEQLDELVTQFENTKVQMYEVVKGLKQDDFNRRPDTGGWSVGECIDHLVVTDTDYTAQIERGLGIARDKNLLSNGPFKYSWLGKKFVTNVEPPVKKRLKNPKKWTPNSGLEMNKVLEDYVSFQNKYIELLRKSAGLDITKVKIPSPATNLIKLTIFDMLNINAAHQRRHLWQAGNVRKAIGL